MEKISQIMEKIKSIFEEVSWFIRLGIVRGLVRDLKKLFTNQWNYIYLLLFFFFYSFLRLKENNLGVILILVVFLFVYSLWKDGNWRGEKRQILKGKYFHSPHPEKLEKEKT